MLYTLWFLFPIRWIDLLVLIQWILLYGSLVQGIVWYILLLDLVISLLGVSIEGRISLHELIFDRLLLHKPCDAKDGGVGKWWGVQFGEASFAMSHLF